MDNNNNNNEDKDFNAYNYAYYVLLHNTIMDYEVKGYMGFSEKYEPHKIDREVWRSVWNQIIEEGYILLPCEKKHNSYCMMFVKKSALIERVKRGEQFYCPCPKCKEEYSVSYNPPVMRPEHWYCSSCNTRYILKSDGNFEEWR